MWRDRGLVKEMVDRAAGAGYEALVLTVDTAVLGRRERDVRRGFALPPKIGLGTMLDGAVHPAWTWAFVRSEPIRVRQRRRSDRSATGPTRCRSPTTSTRSSTRACRGPTSSGCARSGTGRSSSRACRPSTTPQIAAGTGVEAIALSNHGGRQLDSAPPPIDLVAPVADAVGDRIEIICDGGVRRGSDIVKAVALGAGPCMAGRAYLYGLGAAGERGVDHVLGLLDADVRRTMALLGAPTIDDLGRHVLAPDRPTE